MLYIGIVAVIALLDGIFAIIAIVGVFLEAHTIVFTPGSSSLLSVLVTFSGT